ncbi:MAG: hypothetical protein NTW48_00385 [Chloroflexi bacterium]|nr:hypothetical protein [Chloroflexota bacterium]
MEKLEEEQMVEKKEASNETESNGFHKFKYHCAALPCSSLEAVGAF